MATEVRAEHPHIAQRPSIKRSRITVRRITGSTAKELASLL